MAALSVCTPRPRADFSTLVLRGLVDLGRREEKLCLELGVSYWIRHSDVRLDDVAPAMLLMREALIRASGVSPATEPVPFWGVSPRVDVLNLAAYLRGLIFRAAAEAACGANALVEQALRLLEDGGLPFTRMRALG